MIRGSVVYSARFDKTLMLDFLCQSLLIEIICGVQFMWHALIVCVAGGILCEVVSGKWQIYMFPFNEIQQ